MISLNKKIMKTILLLNLTAFMLISCKRENVNDMYPNNSDIIIQDSTVSGMDEISPDSLDETSTVDSTDYDVDSITNQR